MRFTMRSRLSISFGALGKVDINSRYQMHSRLCCHPKRSEEPMHFAVKHKPCSAASSRGSHLHDSPLLNPLLIQLSLKNPVHKHARRMNHVRVEFSRFDEVFHFSDSYL